MIISDLNYLEVVADNTEIVGGHKKKKPAFAYADAYADAKAKGKYFAATFVSVYTYTDTKHGAYSYSSGVASSTSN